MTVDTGYAEAIDRSSRLIATFVKVYETHLFYLAVMIPIQRIFSLRFGSSAETVGGFRDPQSILAVKYKENTGLSDCKN
ncbi:MAG: hypothetical protein SGI77_18775, partial [Pirellulaceae bacterium]|nr:hypothetical protein [Pirellulaceae bacterium]